MRGENRRLDRVDVARIRWRDRTPRRAAIARALEMDAPFRRRVAGFRAARADDRSVRELHRLVLDRPENSVLEVSSRALQVLPPSGDVRTSPHHSCGLAPNLIEEHQRPGLRFEQHRIPARKLRFRPAACRSRPRPARVHLPSTLRDEPNPDIRRALRRSAEPRGDERAADFFDRRRMRARERRGVVDELREHDTRVALRAQRQRERRTSRCRARVS